MPDLVLLIDDDPRLVAALQIRLEASGRIVHTAFNGEEGFSAAKRLLPHLIVLDVNMPGIDGIQVCRLVRADPQLSAIPIILISAIKHESVRYAAMQAGATQFMGKPYLATQMMAAIRAALRIRPVTEVVDKG
jgi:DNA-binding response OmpR family regulator